MKRLPVALAVVALFVGMVAVPAAGGNGRGELMASFNAANTGGSAIFWNSGGEAFNVAAPKVAPEGRLLPFGGEPPLFEDPLEVCDELLVGTWVVIFDKTKALLDLYEQELKLDGVPLDMRRTPYKPMVHGPFDGDWWFSWGVPVLGYLDPGMHEIEWSFSFDGETIVENLITEVHVDAAYCS